MSDALSGQSTYGAVFRAYVGELIKAGTSIEFFLEVNAQPHGEVIAPKARPLGMIADAAKPARETMSLRSRIHRL
ncbi:MAG: hypothetical protein R3C68_19020 [Myxococcota bacterium]